VLKKVDMEEGDSFSVMRSVLEYIDIIFMSIREKEE
jgi:hypothetical protein